MAPGRLSCIFNTKRLLAGPPASNHPRPNPSPPLLLPAALPAPPPPGTACDVVVGGGDKILNKLSGGIDGTYKSQGCFEGKPYYKRDGKARTGGAIPNAACSPLTARSALLSNYQATLSYPSLTSKSSLTPKEENQSLSDNHVPFFRPNKTPRKSSQDGPYLYYTPLAGAWDFAPNLDEPLDSTVLVYSEGEFGFISDRPQLVGGGQWYLSTDLMKDPKNKDAAFESNPEFKVQCAEGSQDSVGTVLSEFRDQNFMPGPLLTDEEMDSQVRHRCGAARSGAVSDTKNFFDRMW